MSSNNSRNLALTLLITAKDQASSILSNVKTQLAGLATAIGAAFSIKEAAVFEKALDAIRARADETGPALEKLIAKAKEAAQTIGPQFGFSATEAAGGIKELIAAGFSGSEAIDALRGTLALAAMEEINVAKAATLISDAIAQFGLTAADASNVADILAKSAGAVAATAVEMAEALKYTGNAASMSGMSLTETSAVLDVLAKAGQRGSEAGTGLASVLNILSNPTHAATKELYTLGATSTQLVNVLDFLQERGIKAASTIALFGEQGGRVINTLLAQGGTKAVAGFAEEISKAGKGAEDTAKIMQQNLLGAFDRFWESLKRVGTELAAPKLEPLANAFDALTEGLNRFASNDKIQAFQKGVSDGFNAIYTAVRNFTNQIDWDGVTTAFGAAFEKIKSATGSAATSLQSIIGTITGSLPGAATIAHQVGDGLKVAWDALGSAAGLLASGLERIAQSLSGPVSAGTRLAQQAIASLTGEVDAARDAHDVLNAAMKRGTVTQEQVTAAWDHIQQATHAAQKDIDSARDKYQAVVAVYRTGAATQEEVTSAWERFQAVIKAGQGKIESAKQAYSGLNLQLTTGKGITEAVAVAHDKFTQATGKARTAIEQITRGLSEQTAGYKSLWEELKAFAQMDVGKVWDDLTLALGTTLKFLNNLVNDGLEYVSGALKTLRPSLKVVSETITGLGTAAVDLLSVFRPSMEGMKASGMLMGNAVSGVINVLATGLGTIAATALKSAEGLLLLAQQLGELTGVLSDEDVAKLEERILKVRESSARMFETAAKSAEAFQNNLKGVGQIIEGTHPSLQKAAEEQKALAEATKGSAEALLKYISAAPDVEGVQKRAAEVTRGLALEIALQKAEVEKLAAADRSSEEAKQKHAAAVQKLWKLQDSLASATSHLTEEQYKSVAANEAVASAIEGLNSKIDAGAETLQKYEAPSKTLKELFATAVETSAKFKELNETYKANKTATDGVKISVQELNLAHKRASDALANYNTHLDININREREATKTSEAKRAAHEAVAKSGQMVIDTEIKIAETLGRETEAIKLTLEKKEAQVASAKTIAAAYQNEAEAAQRITEALQLKLKALQATDKENEEAIKSAKEATDAANAEALAKKASAIEASARIKVLEQEAQQAAIAAGSVGQLTRLYEQQTREHQRAADATERYHDTQLKALDGSIRVAQAHSDEEKAAELLAKRQQVLIEQAEALSRAKAQEAVDAQNAVDVKRLELAVDGELSEADQKQIDALQAVADAKKTAAQQAENHVQALKAEAAATKETATVLENAAQRSARMAKDADEQVKASAASAQKAGSIYDSFYNSAIDVLSKLSTSAVNAFKAMRGETGLATSGLGQLRAEVEDVQRKLSNAGPVHGFMKALYEITAQAIQVKAAFIGQAESAERLTQKLQDIAAGNGRINSETEALLNSTDNLKRRFDLLDDTRLSNLQSAIDAAKEKVKALKDEAIDAQRELADMGAELLELTGHNLEAQLSRAQSDFETKAAAIKERIKEAQAFGDRELESTLQKQLDILAKIRDAKTKNAKAAAAAEDAATDNSADHKIAAIDRVHAHELGRIASTGAIQAQELANFEGLQFASIEKRAAKESEVIARNTVDELEILAQTESAELASIERTAQAKSGTISRIGQASKRLVDEVAVKESAATVTHERERLESRARMAQQEVGFIGAKEAEESAALARKTAEESAALARKTAEESAALARKTAEESAALAKKEQEEREILARRITEEREAQERASQQAKDLAKQLEYEKLTLSGQTAEVEKRQAQDVHTEKLKALHDYYAAAGELGSAEYNAAVKNANDILALKLQNIQDKHIAESDSLRQLEIEHLELIGETAQAQEMRQQDSHNKRLEQLEEEFKVKGTLSEEDYAKAVAMAEAIHAIKIGQIQEQTAATAQVAAAVGDAVKSGGIAASSVWAEQSVHYLNELHAKEAELFQEREQQFIAEKKRIEEAQKYAIESAQAIQIEKMKLQGTTAEAEELDERLAHEKRLRDIEKEFSERGLLQSDEYRTIIRDLEEINKIKQQSRNAEREVLKQREREEAQARASKINAERDAQRQIAESAESIHAELLAAEGKSTEANAITDRIAHEKRMRDIEREFREKGLFGSKEYQQMVRDLERIYALKKQKREEDQARASKINAERDAQRQIEDARKNQQPAPTTSKKVYEIKLGRHSIQTTTDPTKFLEELIAAKRSAA